MKLKKVLLWISLLFIPNVVYATSYSVESIPLGVALSMQAFVSIHMAIFVLYPLANLMSAENTKKTFIKLFIARAVFLLFFDFFVTTAITAIDFIAVFVGAFLIIPIWSGITKKDPYNFQSKNNTFVNTDHVTFTPLPPTRYCSNCGQIVPSTAKFCTNCGTEYVEQVLPERKTVTPADFEPIYSYEEDNIVKNFIEKEMQKANMPLKGTLLPEGILKRKNILSIIMAILLFAYVSMIFFHFPLPTYIVGLIIIIILAISTRKYDLMKYMLKEVKARPSEKISNVVMSIKNNSKEDNTKTLRIVSIIIAIALPLFLFRNPVIWYEKASNYDGYAVRYYIFGLTNFKTATIPSTYKDKPVVSLRGNTFSNMPFLEEVTLPDSVVEIRGQAFKNDYKLTTVNIPSELVYLGGGAFYNCTSITEIELPDTLTYLGGEAFYNAKKLQKVRLSNSLTEIRGDTFSDTALESITIPDSVTRIGGHAFYGNYNLKTVVINATSNLQEIGSSAFRKCNSLRSITLPKGVSINERAFKESPTVINYYESSYDLNEDDYNDYYNDYYNYYYNYYHNN